MNYEEISEHILAELECSLEELESLENREQLERQGIDVQNDIERYSALIDSFKLMVEKAKAFDETIEILKELRDFSKKTEPHSQRMKEKRRNYVQFCDEVLREIKQSYEEVTDEYESGESDEV